MESGHQGVETDIILRPATVVGSFSGMLVLILAFAAVAQTDAAVPAVARNPLAVTGPKGDGGRLMSSDDYPAMARQNGWQGIVIADLVVSPQGRVSKCSIVRSSGYPLLDSKTCSLLTKRAKFHPARDANGNPVEDGVRTPPIIWSL